MSETQWRLHTQQVVNWGGFSGHHTLQMAPSATLLTGASGAGKSTLLDAHIALMMDATVAFNGASNDAGGGRARSDSQRSVLSYMRGVLDTNRDADSGGLANLVLRGADSPTWSGVSMTWVNDDGAQFSAARLYFAPVSATTDSDVSRHYLTVDGALDLGDFEQFAAGRFNHRSVVNAMPDVSFWDTYRTFSATVAAKVGIGAGGDSRKALKLFAKIQAGQQVSPVDDLYKKLVLDVPATYDVAQRTIDHFDDLQASYDTMRTTEEQVALLTGIDHLHATYCAAKARSELITEANVTSTDPRSPLAQWANMKEAQLLNDAVMEQVDALDAANQEHELAQGDVATCKSALADVNAQLASHGGAAKQTLEDHIDRLVIADQKTRAGWAAFTTATAAAVDTDSQDVNAAWFDAVSAHARNFLATFDTAKAALDNEYERLSEKRYPANAEVKKWQTERDSLANRTTLTPDTLHRFRMQLAEQLDLTADDLPFVGELLDLAPAFHPWRLATQHALGGFATTLLVDQEHARDLRSVVNTMQWARRLHFEVVPANALDTGTVLVSDESVLAARLVYKPSPFTGWLSRRIVDRFNYVCVDSVEQLNTHEFALTLAGQTRAKNRGAHGGTNAVTIGFDNKERIAEVDKVILDLTTTLNELDTARAHVDVDRRTLAATRDAYTYVVNTAWNDIDVQRCANLLAEKRHELQELLAGNDRLAELTQQQTKCDTDLEAARVLLYQCASAVTACERQLDAHRTRLQVLAQQPQIGVSDAVTELFDTEYARLGGAGRLPGFSGHVGDLRTRLFEAGQNADREAVGAQRSLSVIFTQFQRRWPMQNLGDDPDASFSGYLQLLETLTGSGLAQRRATFSRKVNEWSGEDLLALHSAFRDAVADISNRLEPVNAILTQLSFGAHDGRLSIVMRRTESADVVDFRKQLKELAANITRSTTDEQVEKRFIRLASFIDRMRATSPERDYFLDVRKHLTIEAEHHVPNVATPVVYTSLGGKSGGETQELVAFIVGAALRYQLGDAGRLTPRYAPVFLDEGFIKADSQFAGRSVAAWLGLGFQLIIGAPNDKMAGIEPYVDTLHHVVKSDDGHSQVFTLQGVA